MLSFLRASSPPRRNTASQSVVLYEDGRSSQTFYGPSEEYFVRHYIPDSSSFFNPPAHIHFYQTETFAVEQGSGIWFLPTAAKASDRETPKRAGDTIFLPAGTYHSFKNPSLTNPLVVRFRVDPEMPSVHSESFFRNFFGYMDDCRVHNFKPSPFQLMLFLHTEASGLAIPVPGPDSVKWWVSRLIMLFLGVVIGEWLLGYPRSHAEYYKGTNTE